MYEIYEILFDVLVPKSIVRGFETLASPRILKLMLHGLLTYSAVLFLWNGLQFLGHIRRTESRQQAAISPLWQIATLAFLMATLHLRMAMAG